MSAPQGYTQTQTPRMTPEMMKLYNNMLSSLGSGPQAGLNYYSKLASGDEDIFKQIEAPAYQALQQGLAQTGNRFSGVGAQDSSAFANAQAGQVGQMAQNLAANRRSLQQNAIDKLLGYSQNLLNQNPCEYQLQEEGGMDWENLVKIFGPILAAMVSGNPTAAAPAVPAAINTFGSLNRSGNAPGY